MLRHLWCQGSTQSCRTGSQFSKAELLEQWSHTAPGWTCRTPACVGEAQMQDMHKPGKQVSLTPAAYVEGSGGACSCSASSRGSVSFCAVLSAACCGSSGQPTCLLSTLVLRSDTHKIGSSAVESLPCVSASASSCEGAAAPEPLCCTAQSLERSAFTLSCMHQRVCLSLRPLLLRQAACLLESHGLSNLPVGRLCSSVCLTRVWHAQCCLWLLQSCCRGCKATA